MGLSAVKRREMAELFAAGFKGVSMACRTVTWMVLWLDGIALRVGGGRNPLHS